MSIIVTPSSPTNPNPVNVSVSTSVPAPINVSVENGSKIHLQFVVGVTSGTSDGMTVYQNDLLVSKKIDVYLDGTRLYPGLVDRLSYTFNPSTGQVNFTGGQLYNPQAVIIDAE